ncbi:MAG: bifunctional lysylphosphatidylglycerol flippase/synthetase MprF [Labedaea sp.]
MPIETARPTTLDSVRRTLESCSDNPSAFLALNRGNHYFTVPGRDGVVVYRESGRHLVQFGGPFAPAGCYPGLLKAFGEFASAAGKRVVAIQLQRSDARRYADAGYTVNQVGASYAVELGAFTTRGAGFVRLRNKISRARRSGVEVREVAQPDYQAAMAGLDAAWLRGKGRHAKPLEFLVGECGGPAQPHRRLFVAEVGATLVGYISYSPVYGSRAGWLHDLSRRRPDGPPGTMEAINAAAIEVFTGEGAGWLHFGFTPFTGLDPAHEGPEASRWFRWLVGQLARRGSAVYPARTQLAYKAKWAPHAVLPEYVAFSGRASLAGFLHVFKVSNAL